jgi:hypothetical protein
VPDFLVQLRDTLLQGLRMVRGYTNADQATHFLIPTQSAIAGLHFAPRDPVAFGMVHILKRVT